MLLLIGLVLASNHEDYCNGLIRDHCLRNEIQNTLDCHACECRGGRRYHEKDGRGVCYPAPTEDPDPLPFPEVGYVHYDPPWVVNGCSIDGCPCETGMQCVSEYMLSGSCIVSHFLCNWQCPCGRDRVIYEECRDRFDWLPESQALMARSYCRAVRRYVEVVHCEFSEWALSWMVGEYTQVYCEFTRWRLSGEMYLTPGTCEEEKQRAPDQVAGCPCITRFNNESEFYL